MESTAETTRVLVGGLADPEAYNHPVSEVRVIETHISWVLLAGDYAYKIKKPLALDFVDFSTLEIRRRYCEDEVRLNRRLAPTIYLGVVAITGSTTQPRMDGAGPALEYAVRMHRFDQEALFDFLLERGALEPMWIDTLAERIATFHATVPAAAADSGFGQPDTTILQPAIDNFVTLRDSAEPSRCATLNKLEAWTRQHFEHLAGLMATRLRDGHVRECHGDLHLGNIALIDGNPVAFDCIEFNAALRWIDVMNEVAFLVMDLADRGRIDLGYRFLDRYLQATGDYAGMAVLRFYLVYRALVRAKVHSLQAQQRSADGHEAQRLEDVTDSYLALARRLAKHERPALILMHGFSASGKSHVAAALVESLTAVRIRSDVERKRLFELDAQADSQSPVAGGLYAEDATARTYEHLAKLADDLLRNKHSVIVDASFLAHWQRECLYSVAVRHDVPFIIANCVADPATLRRRICARTERGDDPSEATMAVLDHQLASHDPFTAPERPAVVDCDTSGRDDVACSVARVTDALARARTVG